MHELGIVFSIAKTVEDIAKENHASHISKVTLEIGKVSSVIPDYLTDCFNWYCTKHEMFTNCKLEIIPIEAITYCQDCEKTYDTIQYGKKCPYCGSEHTYLVQGNENNIKEIEVLD